MLKTSIYIQETLTEKAWYESSNVFYSEFVEDPNKNEGDLYVTFNNGATYKYKNVQIAPDYLMFKHGGLDGSHGKALNSHIKPKYEFEKVDTRDTSKLTEQYHKLIERQEQEKKDNTYFISGHRNLTSDQFVVYKDKISKILNENPKAMFVVGDYQGVDIMAQDFLLDELEIDSSQVTVYHMFDSPRNINPKVVNKVGGFTTDEERDTAMTYASSTDIAYVLDHTKWSGTGQNILRRYLLS
jgi:hypothetical protein